MQQRNPETVSKELLAELRNIAHTDSLAYQFESIKHLAFVNGSGLAASAAVMAGSAKPPVLHVAAAAARLCAWGLVIAVGLLVWRWIWGTLQARKLFGLCLAAESRTITRSEVSDLQLPTFWRIVTFALAGLSLLLFFVAVVIAAYAVQG